jgi:hypothetical protein
MAVAATSAPTVGRVAESTYGKKVRIKAAIACDVSGLSPEDIVWALGCAARRRCGAYPRRTLA